MSAPYESVEFMERVAAAVGDQVDWAEDLAKALNSTPYAVLDAIADAGLTLVISDDPLDHIARNLALIVATRRLDVRSA
jgi:hypothetical protein